MCDIMKKYIMEARIEERKSLILTMLKNGMSPESVSKACGLPLDEVEEVQNELLQTI